MIALCALLAVLFWLTYAPWMPRLMPMRYPMRLGPWTRLRSTVVCRRTCPSRRPYLLDE